MHIGKRWLLLLLCFVLTCAFVVAKESEENSGEEAENNARQEIKETVEELSSARKKEIERLLKHAMESYRKDKFEEAATLFQRILEIAPDHETASLYLEKAKASIAQRKARGEEKRKEGERKTLIEKKKQEERKKRVGAQKQRLAKIHIQRGDECYQSQKLKLAIKEYEKALSIDSENEEAQKKILKVKRQLEEKEKVVEDEKKADKFVDQGRVYFRQGRYEEAIAEWRKVLNLVPANHPDYDRAESWIHVGQLYKTRQEEKKAILQKDISERSSLAGISETWLRREKRRKEAEEEKAVEEEIPVEKRRIEEKAKQIISLHFENAHIRSVLGYLSEISGVNIVLDEEVFPEGAELLEGQTSPRVTIDLEKLPLIEALRVILRAKNLVFRMEENLIWITTSERMAKERLITKIYSLLTAVTRVSEKGAPALLEGEAGEMERGGRLGEEEEEGGEAITPGETIVDILKAGVPWPSGSFINFDKRTGTLVVRNTPTNVDVLEELIRQIEGVPMQVSIEARFMTISTQDLRRLGIEYPHIRLGLGTQGNLNIERAIGYGVDFNEASLRGQGLALSYTKLNPTQFQMLLDAIESSESVNLLSAPKVMTRNQQEAEIRVVDEYRFPDGWETFFYVYYADLNEDGWTEPVQGATIVPTSFVEPTEIGIMLTVTPDIGADMNITLKIRPIFNEFMGWIVYGTSVYGAEEEIDYIQLEEVYEQQIDTQVVVRDGETIVMGGLVREKSSERVRKVPFFGDIPILGRLFRRTAEKTDKESLLIFISTYLVKPTGERYQI